MSRAFSRAASRRGLARVLGRNSARGLTRGLTRDLAHVLALVPARGPPREPRPPASDASGQAFGGRNGLLSPRGERGVSDDLAPRPQPLPRAVPAAGTSAECAAKLHWHPFRRHAGVDLGGAALQRSEAIDGAKDSGAVQRQVRGRVLLRRPTPWAGRVRDTSPWTEPPVNAWAW